jgi:hypothetical protein
MREFAFRLEADTEPRFWQLMRACTPSCARVRILPNLPDQSLRRTRDWDRPVQDLFAFHTSAVHSLVAGSVSLNDGTVQTDAGKCALATGVSQDLGVQLRSVSAAACRPTGPAAAVASAPILNLSLSRLCMPCSLLIIITTSLAAPPICRP